MLEPLRVPDDPAILHRLGDHLRATGYESKKLLEYLGVVEIPSPDSAEAARLLYRTRAGTPLDALVRLLLIGETVGLAPLRAALGGIAPEDLAALGLFRVAGDRVVPGVVVFPYSDLLLVCDAPPERRASDDPDLAVGVTESSIVLQFLTLRLPVRRALDLGCGCGVQSLLAAGHATEVTGIDSVGRCVAAARINALLNRCDRATFLEGDGFDPVRGRRFDLIVANLPFMVAPSLRYHYSDSGHELDGFPRRIAAEAPSLLEEGGFCQFLCEWIHPRGADWRTRLEGWFDNCGCDVWVIPIETRKAGIYAEEALQLNSAGGGGGTRQYAEWLAYYERHGVEAITTGAVILRRRQGANWFRIDDETEWSRTPASDAILTGFALRDFVESTSEAVLAATPFRVNEKARLVQRLRREDNAWVTDTAEIRFDTGFCYPGKVDRWIAALLATADGEKPLGEVVTGLARQSGYPADKFAAAFAPVVRHLIERGFLLPPGDF